AKATGAGGGGGRGRGRSTLVRRRAVRSRPSGDRITSTPASAAAVSAGEGAVVKMYERARFTTSSVYRAGPATKPPSAPTVLDRGPIRTASTPMRSGSEIGRAHVC